jgi:mannose-6-phosphate isomerase-like protein (cupin superfamily)
MTLDAPSPRAPAVVRLQDVDVLQPDQTPAGVRLARIITKGDTGSDMLLGACWLAPGEVTTFDLSDPGNGPLPAQEIYFVIRGRIRATYGDGAVEVGAEEAIWFAPGREYRVEGVGEEEAFLVYVVAPAPR